MQISELARLTGVTVHALRHYERAGLLRPDRLPNGYRHYAPSARREVVFIAMSRALGFGVPQIRSHLLAQRLGGLQLDHQLVAIDHQIEVAVAVLVGAMAVTFVFVVICLGAEGGCGQQQGDCFHR